jgi:hypothetical protein
MKQPLMGFAEQFWQRFWIVVGTILDRRGKVAPHDETTIAIFLEKEETSCPLDIGEGLGRGLVEEIKPPATHDAVTKIPQEFLMMLLTDAKEVEYVF